MTKKKKMWQEVSIRNEGRKEENVEGLVNKSKGFLPMNLSNPKGESFDAEGIGCVGGREIKSRSLKKKIGERLFSRYYSRLLQIIQSGSGFGLFFPLIIHIQTSKLHFGSYGKNEESKRNPFDI